MTSINRCCFYQWDDILSYRCIDRGRTSSIVVSPLVTSQKTSSVMEMLTSLKKEERAFLVDTPDVSCYSCYAFYNS